MSIKDILRIPQTPLFITFADAKKFSEPFSQMILTGLNPT